jgi:hypothetical protein
MQEVKVRVFVRRFAVCRAYQIVGQHIRMNVDQFGDVRYSKTRRQVRLLMAKKKVKQIGLVIIFALVQIVAESEEILGIDVVR